MSNINISVIIPVYNSGETIIRAITSVIKQTYDGAVEIIIVNDGSTDNSLSIIEKFKSEILANNIQIINQSNGGVQMARNAGLRIAKGEWIALIDSDDYWLPNKLEMQMEVIINNNNIDFLGSNRNNESTRILWRKKDKLSKITFKELLIKIYPQTSTAIFRRSLLKDVGFYDENLRVAEDADYWIRISLKKGMYFMPESLVITGDGKPNFGFSGLSSNLKELEKGFSKVLYKNFKLKNINLLEYLLFRGYYFLKYIRRVLIVKLRKI